MRGGLRAVNKRMNAALEQLKESVQRTRLEKLLVKLDAEIEQHMKDGHRDRAITAVNKARGDFDFVLGTWANDLWKK